MARYFERCESGAGRVSAHPLRKLTRCRLPGLALRNWAATTAIHRRMCQPDSLLGIEFAPFPDAVRSSTW